MTLADHLRAAVDIDEAVRRAATPDVLTIPAVEIEDLARIPKPGRARLVEDLWLARRTFSTIHFLMLHTSRSSTPAGDFTEDAAVLVRRLLELLAQVSWLTDYEAPAGVDLPAQIGRPTDFDDVGTDAPWPTQQDRELMVAYVASATEWVDLQALRADRSEVRQLRKTATAMADADATEAEADRFAGGLEVLEARDRLIERRLDIVGADTSSRHDNVSILSRLGSMYVVAYRYESDATHGMAMGRLHQRGEEPMLGASSPEWRREMVMATANATMLEIANRVLGFLQADRTELETLAAEHQQRMRASVAPSGEQDPD